ncbi:bola-like protein [Polychaeton citri CBS 116435]|uniref:Bola-like protein n=1 Tax=Polychaeton citri CBS 116435 TaxID=1314669 RepID=A0A9P4Q215_9PEZI|nr:bola-like protein [Polychaeton citri CBS 116435]
MAALRSSVLAMRFSSTTRSGAALARSRSSRIMFPNAVRNGTAAGACAQRQYSTGAVEPPEFLSEGELKIFNMLKEGLGPEKLEVQDISGGCGSMYGIDVVSDKFKGLPVIKQHRLVNQVLGEEIKKWHGVQLKTKAP